MPPHHPTGSDPSVPRTPIRALPTSGLSGLPDLAAAYQAETRTSPSDPWQPQQSVTQAFMLRGLEWLLRRDLATAEAEGRTLHVTTPDLPESTPCSRYVPLDEP
ncbi:hypothetical protein ACWCQB_37665 [Streptomyces hirsutus]